MVVLVFSLQESWLRRAGVAGSVQLKAKAPLTVQLMSSSLLASPWAVLGKKEVSLLTQCVWRSASSLISQLLFLSSVDRNLQQKYLSKERSVEAARATSRSSCRSQQNPPSGAGPPPLVQAVVNQ
eukprot:281230-Amphidinium_carterae.1